MLNRFLWSFNRASINLDNCLDASVEFMSISLIRLVKVIGFSFGDKKMVGHKFAFYATLKPNMIKDLKIRYDYREEFACDHTVVLYGDPSPQLLEGARIMMPYVKIKVYSFLQGLE